MRYAAILTILGLAACNSANNGASDTVRNSDSVVVDSGAGRDTLNDSIVVYPDKKPKKEKK